METSGSQANNALRSLSESLTAAVEAASVWVVAVDARPRVPTSGVVWRENIIVSTNHTIRRSDEITIKTGGGKNISVTLVGRDASTDLAVLRIESDNAEKLASAQIADSSALKVGSFVLAIGRAHPERGVSASAGIISHTGGEWRTWRGGVINRLIRPDVSVFTGFSGGALVDAEGRVVGINTTGLARGAGLTIPVETINRVVDELLTRGHVARPYLGVGMQPVRLPEDLRDKLNSPAASGLIMLSVERNAPADKAGIMLGDILIALNDKFVADTDDVQTALSNSKVGQTIKAVILRGGEQHEVSITIGEKPVRRE